MTETDQITRDANGRFVPGCSGNPAGKAPGTRNRASVLAEALFAGEAEAIARVVVNKALAGDAVAARFCIDRLSPRPRARAIRLDVPEDLTPGGTVVATFNAALRAMADGEITPDEAVTVSRVVEGRWRVLRAWQMERKLTWAHDSKPIPGERDARVQEADEDDEYKEEDEYEDDEEEVQGGVSSGSHPIAAPPPHLPAAVPRAPSSPRGGEGDLAASAPPGGGAGHLAAGHQIQYGRPAFGLHRLGDGTTSCVAAPSGSGGSPAPLTPG